VVLKRGRAYENPPIPLFFVRISSDDSVLLCFSCVGVDFRTLALFEFRCCDGLAALLDHEIGQLEDPPPGHEDRRRRRFGGLLGRLGQGHVRVGLGVFLLAVDCRRGHFRLETKDEITIRTEIFCLSELRGQIWRFLTPIEDRCVISN
jgi:hypothetical protein